MSELRVEAYEMPGVQLGPENPLPSLRNRLKHGPPPKYSDDIPEEDRKYIGYGCDAGPLPHRMQDSYTRRRRVRSFKALVLENDILRATFLIELGGRLWSLYHKPARRELLYVNPVFQPANLAVRDAWFSGGVEWNVGVYGHTPYTCSPLFAARVDGGAETRSFACTNGTASAARPTRWISPCRTVLPGCSRTCGSSTRTPPKFPCGGGPTSPWPSARMSASSSRPITPCFTARGCCSAGTIPVHDGVDKTYATHMSSAASIFFEIPRGERPWIAALDKEGRGLVQTSTRRLPGRKLFAWGTGPGGRRWAEFLSVPELAVHRNPGRHRAHAGAMPPMPAGAEWTWTEAYGLMEADAVPRPRERLGRCAPRRRRPAGGAPSAGAA